MHGDQFQTYVDPLGNDVDTYRRVLDPGRQSVPRLRLRRPRARLDRRDGPERDGGFLAPGSRNDLLALSYFEGQDLPMYSALARRFLVFDDWHASLLGPTNPNRLYLLSAQSGGTINNDLPDLSVGFQWDTIIDRLRGGGRFGCRLLQRPPADWRSSARA